MKKLQNILKIDPTKDTSISDLIGNLLLGFGYTLEQTGNLIRTLDGTNEEKDEKTFDNKQQQSESSIDNKSSIKEKVRTRSTKIFANSLIINLAKGVEVKNGCVAVFTDAQGSMPISNYKANIGWGDRTSDSIATIIRSGDLFKVLGNHTYDSYGTYSIVVVIEDKNGRSSTVENLALIGSINDRFIVQVYTDLINQVPDSNEHQYYIAKLEHGVSFEEIVLEITHRPEYISKQVEKIYNSYLHRDPNSEELKRAQDYIANGKTFRQIEFMVLGSDEYFEKRGDGNIAGTLTALFEDIMKRTITANELSLLSEEIENGKSRNDVIINIYNADEAKTKAIESIWNEYIHKEADTTIISYLKEKVRHEKDALAYILGSGFYLHRDKFLRINEFIDPRKLYQILFPILETNYNNPQYDTSNFYWSRNLASTEGKVFLENDDPNKLPVLEWTPIFGNSETEWSYLTNEPTIVGLSGWVVKPELSTSDIPFTHPFESETWAGDRGNDFTFNIAPDSQYMNLLAPTNFDLSQVSPNLQSAEPDLIEALEVANDPKGLNLGIYGLLHVETDRGLIPPEYRMLDGNNYRVAAFGRWIIDSGHDNFQSEMHPPLLIVSGFQPTLENGELDSETTQCNIISRPYLVSQYFSVDQRGLGRSDDHWRALREHLDIEIRKVVGDHNVCALPAPGEYLVSPCSDRIEIHPRILPPFNGYHNLHFIIRPPSPRKSPNDKLLVSYSFKAHTGVIAYGFSNGDDSLWFNIRMDGEDYNNITFRQPNFRPHTIWLPQLTDWINPPPPESGDNEILKLNDDQNSQIASTLNDVVNKISFYASNTRHFKETINKGILMDVYNAPFTGPNDGDSVIDMPIEDVTLDGSMPGVTVDNNQAFPIYGWIQLRWERH